MVHGPRIQRHNPASLVCISSSTNGEISEVKKNEDITNSNETWQNPRSRWARRKHRRKMEKLHREGEGGTQIDDGNILNWDKFEFGDR